VFCKDKRNSFATISKTVSKKSALEKSKNRTDQTVGFLFQLLLSGCSVFEPVDSAILPKFCDFCGNGTNLPEGRNFALKSISDPGGARKTTLLTPQVKHFS
tara:strand:+ start:336 stop:638 length:303 start_codon:yes stop_codon:yes gene_type:complete